MRLRTVQKCSELDSASFKAITTVEKKKKKKYFSVQTTHGIKARQPRTFARSPSWHGSIAVVGRGGKWWGFARLGGRFSGFSWEHVPNNDVQNMHGHNYIHARYASDLYWIHEMRNCILERSAEVQAHGTVVVLTWRPTSAWKSFSPKHIKSPARDGLQTHLRQSGLLQCVCKHHTARTTCHSVPSSLYKNNSGSSGLMLHHALPGIHSPWQASPPGHSRPRPKHQHWSAIWEERWIRRSMQIRHMSSSRRHQGSKTRPRRPRLCDLCFRGRQTSASLDRAFLLWDQARRSRHQHPVACRSLVWPRSQSSSSYSESGPSWGSRWSCSHPWGLCQDRGPCCGWSVGLETKPSSAQR